MQVEEVSLKHNIRTPDVSVIIVNYNTYELTRDAVFSIFEKTEDVFYEIIVVDNASPDGRGKDLERLFSNKIIYVQSNENIGFGRANNLGAVYASGRNLFLLNPDTCLLNNAIKILSDYLDNNPNVGICGGNLFDEGGNPTHSYKTYFPGMMDELKLFFGNFPRKFLKKHPDFNYSNKPKPVAYITGADLMIRHCVFSNGGGFDPDFFMYFEETELSFRVKKSGLLILNIPRAHIAHLVSNKFEYDTSRIKQLEHGRYVYFKKTTPCYTILLITILAQIHLFIKVCLYTLLGNKDKVKMYKFIIGERRALQNKEHS